MNNFELGKSFRMAEQGTDEPATIIFSKKAFTKIYALVKNYESEVAWQGKVERCKNFFIVKDIVVYPQTVTGATVDMNESEYALWLMKNAGNENYVGLNFQGHSHVRMPVTPSGTDIKHQFDIVNNVVNERGFYVFIIVNKFFDNVYTAIYDAGNGIYYGSNCTQVFVAKEECDNQKIKKYKDDVLQEAEACVKKEEIFCGHELDYGFV